MFKDSVFTSGTLVASVMFAMLFSQTFLLPVFMQEMLGFTAVQAGLALMPRSLVMMVAMPVVGRLYSKVSPRGTVAFGILLFAGTSYMMSHYTLETGPGDIIAALVLQGIAMSCLWIPLTTVALARVPRDKLTDATGLNALVRQIGGSVGLATFATLIPRYSAQAASALSAHLTLSNPVVEARVRGVAGAMQARGIDPETATTLALR
jgi:DHA2 family multidrug resistance protein